MFTLFFADSVGNNQNCSYPHMISVSNKDDLIKALSHDYVCAEYKDNKRSNLNFICGDCLPMDCDNDHSDDPSEWVTPQDVAKIFPGVEFAVHYSRNNNKVKGSKAARPRFHILFSISKVSDVATYTHLKQQTYRAFHFFDGNALDAARFFFGTENPQIEIFYGNLTLDTYLREYDPVTDEPVSGSNRSNSAEVIPQGKRNTTLYSNAVKYLKRHGNCKKARDLFDADCQKCVPPLDYTEIEAIWKRALDYLPKIQSESGYIPPNKYNSTKEPMYMPKDWTDLGQASVLCSAFGNHLKYTPATGFLVYTKDHYWEENEVKARKLAHHLTDKQMEESKMLVKHFKNLMNKEGISEKRAVNLTQKQYQILNQYRTACKYSEFSEEYRASARISATVKEVSPMVYIDLSDLDKDEFLLNTPEATYDLKEGLEGSRKSSPGDLITKITAVAPCSDGEDIWQDCLNTVFLNDSELIEYVQLICGLAAIGKIFVEALIIAYGTGRNGKSTFWNTIAHVLGTYSGNISADTLTMGCRRNIKPEMAEIKGKRLLIAAELPEGTRLNDSTVKQLCSTDDVFAEKKYKDPFSFKPSHTLVLYTNHLPKVGASDDGTWRRLIVIPFNAKIEGNSDIKNYSDYLIKNAGGAVLSWIIEGARKVISLDYKILPPPCVRDAIEGYREQNDWFSHFLEDKCEIGDTYSVASSKLYNAYRTYCSATGEYVRSTTEFYSSVEAAGFKRTNRSGRKFIKGIQLNDAETQFDDFLK